MLRQQCNEHHAQDNPRSQRPEWKTELANFTIHPGMSCMVGNRSIQLCALTPTLFGSIQFNVAMNLGAIAQGHLPSKQCNFSIDISGIDYITVKGRNVPSYFTLNLNRPTK